MPGPWGRGRRERLFEKGDLKYLFLDLLRETPRHGYDLMRAIEERSGGRYQASPGAVYPILQMLEDQGLVTARTTDGRKTYAITPEGERFLQDNADSVRQVWQRAEGAWDAHGPQDWHRLGHELGAFGHLFGRARAERLTPDKLARIFAILARARAEVESILDE